MAEWKYSIKAYQRAADNGLAWTPARECEATMWMCFRERGDDRRVFGAFQNRAEAERATELMKRRERDRGMEM